MKSEAVFPGTFDPFHGAHLGQLLRAQRSRQLKRVAVLIDKQPAHKPHVTDWQHRLEMARLVLEAYEPPFDYTIQPVDSTLAFELDDSFDYKIIGVDSLLEDLSEPRRWRFAQRWPMLVLSTPGIADRALPETIAALPPDVQATIVYEYVSEAAVPMLNYDFDEERFVAHRVHSTGLRAGEDTALIPLAVRQYIRNHQLYLTGQL